MTEAIRSDDCVALVVLFLGSIYLSDEVGEIILLLASSHFQLYIKDQKEIATILVVVSCRLSKNKHSNSLESLYSPTVFRSAAPSCSQVSESDPSVPQHRTSQIISASNLATAFPFEAVRHMNNESVSRVKLDYRALKNVINKKNTLFIPSGECKPGVMFE